MTLAAVTGATSLGPQCRKCRARRVKCDSNTPHCNRCLRDNFDCPGYGDRRTKWTITTPATISNANKTRSRASPSKSSAPSTATASPSTQGDTDSVALQPFSTHSAFSPTYTPFPSYLRQPDDLMCHQFNDALAYWTSMVKPLLPCSPLTGPVRNISREQWTSLPRIMLHSTVSTITTVRLVREGMGNRDSEVNTRVQLHRGRALVLLRGYLQDLQDMRSEGFQQPILGWSALVFVTIIMATEFTVGATGSAWALHLAAAWTLVGLQGGFPRPGRDLTDTEGMGALDSILRSGAALDPIWRSGLEPERTCAWLLLVEVFSATTCPVWALERRDGMQEALRDDVFDDLEERMLTTICPCPSPILRALAGINELRLDLYAAMTHANRDSPNDFSNRLWDILTSLICFDTAAWADKLYERHPADPPAFHTDEPCTYGAMWRLSWATLADCYRSAAILYLVRSLQSTYLQTLAMPALACTAFIRMQNDDAASLLVVHHRSLAESLAFLMRDYDDPASLAKGSYSNHQAEANSPRATMPNLWRYLSWPLFIDAYEAVMPSKVHSGKRQQDKIDARAAEKTTRLACMGRTLGANCLVDGAALLDNARARRSNMRVWSWDDAFERRCIFAI